MEDKIKRYLLEIEKEKDIKILLACETGSRAWGFPSPDSDYDIRVIYVKRCNWYLSLHEGTDSFTKMLDENEIDISGWELRKSLRLLMKSNAPMLERIQSPIVYMCDSLFLSEINLLSDNAYSKISTMHHYLSMAKKFIESLSTDSPYKLKTFFYALRSSIACLWILNHDKKPPIEFKIMLTQLEIAPQLIARINTLIELKATISESYMHKGENEIIEYMKKIVEKAELSFKSLPGNKIEIDRFNTLFRQFILEHDN